MRRCPSAEIELASFRSRIVARASRLFERGRDRDVAMLVASSLFLQQLSPDRAFSKALQVIRRDASRDRSGVLSSSEARAVATIRARLKRPYWTFTDSRMLAAELARRHPRRNRAWRRSLLARRWASSIGDRDAGFAGSGPPIVATLGAYSFGRVAVIDLAQSLPPIGAPDKLHVVTFACCRFPRRKALKSSQSELPLHESLRIFRRLATSVDLLFRDMGELWNIGRFHILIDDGAALHADALLFHGSRADSRAVELVAELAEGLAALMADLACGQITTISRWTKFSGASPKAPGPVVSGRRFRNLAARDEAWLRLECGDGDGASSAAAASQASRQRVRAYAAQGHCLAEYFTKQRGFLLMAERPSGLKTAMFRAGLNADASLPMLVCCPNERSRG